MTLRVRAVPSGPASVPRPERVLGAPLDSGSASDGSALRFLFLNLRWVHWSVLDEEERPGQAPAGPLCLSPVPPSSLDPSPLGTLGRMCH